MGRKKKVLQFDRDFSQILVACAGKNQIKTEKDYKEKVNLSKKHIQENKKVAL